VVNGLERIRALAKARRKPLLDVADGAVQPRNNCQSAFSAIRPF